MKNNFKTIFASMLAVLSCASCSQNDNIVSDQDLTPKALVISLPKTATSRSVEGALVLDGAPKYSNITVILYDAGKNAMSYEWIDFESATLKIESVLPPAGVEVLVNLSADQLAALKTANSEAKVKAVLTEIPVAYQNQEPIAAATPAPYYTSAQQATYSGSTTTITAVPESGGVPAHNTAAVVLSSITSRFEMGAIKVKTDGGLDAIEIEKVFFNNYLSLNDAATIVNLKEGVWLPTGTPAGIDAQPWSMIDGVSTATLATQAYAFQCYAGAVIPQIILRVSGTVAAGFKLADGTEGAFTGKYVTINGFKTGTGETAAKLMALEAHKVYQVAMETPLDISAGDITDGANKAEVGLNVTISVKAWSKETLTPEIQ